jgi:hypothetical protein
MDARRFFHDDKGGMRCAQVLNEPRSAMVIPVLASRPGNAILVHRVRRRVAIRASRFLHVHPPRYSRKTWELAYLPLR